MTGWRWGPMVEVGQKLTQQPLPGHGDGCPAALSQRWGLDSPDHGLQF